MMMVTPRYVERTFFFSPFITVSMYLLQVVRFLGMVLSPLWIHVYFAENISLDKNLYEIFFSRK